MENSNELNRLAQSETTQMVAAILRGENPKGSDNPTVIEKTHQQVLQEIETTYKEMFAPPTKEKK